MKLRLLLFLLLCAPLPMLAQDYRPSCYQGQVGVITVRGGKMQGAVGGVTTIATQDITPPLGATSYIYMDLTGVPIVRINQTGYPAGQYFPICTTTKDAGGTITSLLDTRPEYYFGGAGPAMPNTNLACTATPAFNGTTNSSYSMTLCQNVTSSTITGAPVNGNLLSLSLCQDATGGRTFAFPANVTAVTVNPSPNACTYVTYKFDGTNWIPISVGGGGGASPAGNNGDLQMQNSGSLGASSINDNGTNLVSVSRDLSLKGPSPWIDVRQYGVRAVPVGSVPSTTGSINSGSATLTVASATGFIVGDGIKVVGAGSTNGLSTPAAPTVTAVNASGPLKTGRVIANATGATTYQYQIVARGAGGAYTPASTATAIANGAATLGAQTASITNWSQSGATVTVNLTATANLVSNAYVYITGDRLLNGYHRITVASGTQFTYTDATSQTVAATASSATVNYFTGNHISWSAVSGAWTYCIYGRTGGAMALLGVSYPENNDARVTNDPLYNTFDDWGSALTTTGGELTCPSTPPGAAKNNDLVTTITNIVGTTFTLNATASNTVAAATCVFDNAPNILAAVTASTANKTTQVGVVYFPATGGVPNTLSYVVNSFLNLASNPMHLAVMQEGRITINDSMLWDSYTVWKGWPQLTSTGTSFQYEAYNRIDINSPVGIWHFGSITLERIQINGTGVNQMLMVEDPNAGVSQNRFDRVAFTSGGNDCTGIHFTNRTGILGGGADQYNYLDMLPGGCSSVTTAPLWLRTREGGTYEFTKLSMHLRGIVFGGGTQAVFNWIYEQAATNQPKITLLSATAFGNDLTHDVEIKNSIEDTTPEPVVSYVGVAGGSMISYKFSFSGQNPLVQGDGTAFVDYTGINDTYIFHQTLNGVIRGVRTTVLDSINTGATPSRVGLTQNYQHLAVAANYKVFANGAQMAAPTCTATAGGSVPNDTYTVKVAPVYASGGEGFLSSQSNSCTTSAGVNTLTITITPATGAIGYNFYRAASGSPQNWLQMSCSSPALVGGASTSYVFTAGSICGASSGNPTFAGGGPTELRSAALDATTINLVNGFKSTFSANALTANRTIAAPDASGQLMLSPVGATFGANHIVATDANGLVSDWNVAPGTVYDSFVRANGTIMAGNVNWVTVPGTSNINVSGNTITAGAAGYNIAAYSGITFPADDQTARVRVTNAGTGANAFGWVTVRTSTSANTWYGCGANKNTNVFELRKLVSGSATTITSAAYVPTVGDVWAIRAFGTTITCTINGVQPFAPQTDASIGVGGFPGVGFFGTNALSTSDFAASFGGVSLNAAQTWSARQTAAGLTDTTLTASQPVCTDASKNLISNDCTASFTETYTNKTLDAEGTGNTVTIPTKLFFRAAVCNVSTAAFGADVTAAGALAACYGTTSKIGVAQMADTDAVTWSYLLTSDFTGNIDGKLVFNSPDTSGTAIFNVALACVDGTGGTADDPAYNASSAFGTITLAAPANANWSTTVSNITKSGTTTCAAGTWMNIKLTRATDSATSRVNVKALELTVRRAM